jgi:hypothetical protein
LTELPEPLDVRPGDTEGWAEAIGGRFEEAYRLLRSYGFRPKDSFIGAWLSCHKDDRGSLSTVGELADWLGIARQTVYNHIKKHRLNEWAEQLRLLQLRGDALGEVDRVALAQARDPEAPVAARRLYYERAGVLKEQVDIEVIGDETRFERLLQDLRDAEDDG